MKKEGSLLFSFFLLLLPSILLSCSNLRTKREDNPFLRHGIKSIAIPMFINRSSFPGVNMVLTREFFRVLSSFDGLSVLNGENRNADALFLGLVDSPLKKGKALTVVTETPVGTSEGIARRGQFLTPLTLSYEASLVLTLVKIKDGRNEIIFEQRLPFIGAYNKTLGQGKDHGNDSLVLVNQTKSLGEARFSFEKNAEALAEQFRHEVLNVF